MGITRKTLFNLSKVIVAGKAGYQVVKMIDELEFRRQLDLAEKYFQSWPEWKKDLYRYIAHKERIEKDVVSVSSRS